MPLTRDNKKQMLIEMAGWNCAICLRTLKNIRMLQTHYMRVHTKRQIVCRILTRRRRRRRRRDPHSNTIELSAGVRLSYNTDGEKVVRLTIHEAIFTRWNGTVIVDVVGRTDDLLDVFDGRTLDATDGRFYVCTCMLENGACHGARRLYACHRCGMETEERKTLSQHLEWHDEDDVLDGVLDMERAYRHKSDAFKFESIDEALNYLTYPY